LIAILVKKTSMVPSGYFNLKLRLKLFNNEYSGMEILIVIITSSAKSGSKYLQI